MTNTAPKPSTPNIFSIATSELSQDALITWLLQWADTKYATIQPELHSCGQKLVRALCDIHSSTIDTSTLTFNKVEVKRQWNKLDIPRIQC
jgi:hypothetical protein